MTTFKNNKALLSDYMFVFDNKMLSGEKQPTPCRCVVHEYLNPSADIEDIKSKTTSCSHGAALTDDHPSTNYSIGYKMQLKNLN